MQLLDSVRCYLTGVYGALRYVLHLCFSEYNQSTPGLPPYPCRGPLSKRLSPESSDVTCSLWPGSVTSVQWHFQDVWYQERLKAKGHRWWGKQSPSLPLPWKTFCLCKCQECLTIAPIFFVWILKKKLDNDERLWGCSQSMDKDTQPLCQVKSHLSIDTIYTTTPAPKVQGTLRKGVQIKEELKDQNILYK